MPGILPAVTFIALLALSGCSGSNPSACCHRAGCQPSGAASCRGSGASCSRTAGGAACCTANPRVLRHVVLFKFKDGTSAEDVRKVQEAFRSLPAKIGQIADFEWGTDVSPEKRAEGFTHCFLLTFRTEADRDAYLPHPDHKAFGQALGPHLEKVLVVDYWAKK